MRHLLLTEEELEEYNDDPEGHVYEESIARESDSVINRRDIRRDIRRDMRRDAPLAVPGVQVCGALPHQQQHAHHNNRAPQQQGTAPPHHHNNTATQVRKCAERCLTALSETSDIRPRVKQTVRVCREK